MPLIETNAAVSVKFAAAMVKASVSSAVILVTDDVDVGSGTVMVTVSVKTCAANSVKNVKNVAGFDIVIKRRI